MMRATQPAAAPAGSYSYHTVIHPVVLALAVPPNPLSEREHFRWEDDDGLVLARRMRGDVTYFGPGYERALFEYYVSLWKSQPGAMVSTYWAKLRATGRGVFLQAWALTPRWWPFRRLYLAAADRVNGVALLVGAVAATALALRRLRAHASAPALVVTLAGTVVTLLLLEAAIVYSLFYIGYHSALLFAVMVSPAVALQAAIDLVPTLRHTGGGASAMRAGAQ
jgi:hypothetical protein